MKRFISACMLLCLLLSLTACGGKTADSPYVGTWNATKYSALGIDIAVEEMGASTLEFKAGGRMTADFMGQSGSGKWEETDSGLVIKSGGEEIPCTIEGSELVLDYSGVSIYFEKEGGFGGAAGAASDASPETAPDGTSAPGITAAEQWGGYWYGKFWKTKTYTDNYDDDSISDYYAYIYLDDEGYGYLDANPEEFLDEDEHTAELSMWIKGDADRLEQTGEEAWFWDMEIVEGENGNDFVITPAGGNRDMFIIKSSYTDPETGTLEFDYQFTFLRFGKRWDTNVDPVTPPGYEAYIEES